MTTALLATIGESLRAARERRGLTLEQAAELASLSKSHLSRLESSDRQPSIAALLALSSALRIPVGVLLGHDEQGGAPIEIAADDEPRRESKGLSIAPCSGYPGSHLIEALRVTVDPNRSATTPARHAGEEWLFVISGHLRLEYDGESHVLDPGMTAHFDAERPHRLIAEGDPVELMLVAAKDTHPMQNIH